MVAQLFLVLHDPEVVIVTGAEQAIRENLVIAATTGYHPHARTGTSEPFLLRRGQELAGTSSGRQLLESASGPRRRSWSDLAPDRRL